MMRLGPDTGPVVVMVLPLFEEANRTRAVAVATLRTLAGIGVAGVLPDLPGQGESLIPTHEATLPALREALSGAVDAIAAGGRAVYVAAIRSGALLDPLALARGRWHLSPQDGPALLRELTRIRQQEVGRDRPRGNPSCIGGPLPAASSGPPVSIAGNLISPRLLAALAGAIPDDASEVPRRVVRLDGDPRPAARHLNAPPPWRRAEPGGDDVLAQSLAADIADWIRACGAR